MWSDEEPSMFDSLSLFRDNVTRTHFLEKDYADDAACVDEMTQLLLGNGMLVKEEEKEENTSSQPQHLLLRKERKLKTRRLKNFKLKKRITITRHSVRRLFIFIHFSID